MRARQGQLGISGEIVGPVLRALDELGFDAKPLMAEGGPIVTASFADTVLDAAARELHDDAIGLTLARRLPIGSLGILDYSLCTSTRLGDALVRVAKYYGLVTQRVKLTLSVAGPRASLVFARPPGEGYSRHWAEFAPAMIALRMGQTLGRAVSLEDVSFTHAPPADTSKHAALFGVPVRFDRPRDEMSFEAALLDAPLVTAAASLAELLEDKMRALEPAMGTEDPLVARVHVAIALLLDERETSLAAAAARLRMTRRTLQRELQERGTSHTQMLDDARRERALRLLEEGELTVTEVAYRLGLSEPSAFFRAFRRWTGTSPKAFQKGFPRTR